MEIFREIKALRAYLGHRKKQTDTIGFVPTMGALHQGHLSLIAQSKAENRITVCSIFVNPTQFNNPADLEKYPRDLDRDIQLLREANCDVLFIPDVKEMYAQKSSVKIDFGYLDKILEGEFRPGHFSGVALVVSKLFNIVQPSVAYFGQKDFQQYKIVSVLAEELLFEVQLKSVRTLREPDGLAMSSRNQRLTPDQRKKAIVFYQSLLLTRQWLTEKIAVAEIIERIKKKFEAIDDVRLEYLVVANAENLKPVESVSIEPNTVILIAGYVGEIRLIDNLLLEE